MKVLITGGAGFIGSHLAESLLDRGDEVFVIDDLSTGMIENIEHLKNRPGFHYTIDSILNRPLTAELVDRCNVIFHLAAAVGVSLIIDSPVRTIETNVKGTEIILELASKKKKCVFLASTSEVYGKGVDTPYSEEGDLVLGSTNKGRWSYACSKALDEFLALAYCREKQLPVVIVRLFNTVGPRQTGKYGMVLPRFIKQALTGEPITVYGDGKQSRCFTHINDVTAALLQMTNRDDLIGEIINVGNDYEITIEALAKKVKLMANSHSEIEYLPYEYAYEDGFEDMRRRIPNLSKIKRLIAYEPAHSIEEIIADTLEYYRNRDTVVDIDIKGRSSLLSAGTMA
jgi:UDP-glucose 4-epimerase